MVAKTDAEALLNVVIPAAQQALEDHGEFYPFGAAITPNDEIVFTMGFDGRDHPPADDMTRLLIESFRKDADFGKYKATAIAYDIRWVDPRSGKTTDAIAVMLDHRDNYSSVVIFPYTSVIGRDITLGNPIAEKGEYQIFGQPKS